MGCASLAPPAGSVVFPHSADNVTVMSRSKLSRLGLYGSLGGAGLVWDWHKTSLKSFKLPLRRGDENMVIDSLEQRAPYSRFILHLKDPSCSIWGLSAGVSLPLCCSFSSFCPPLCVVIAFHIAPVPTANTSTSAPSPPLTAGIETCLPTQRRG